MKQSQKQIKELEPFIFLGTLLCKSINLLFSQIYITLISSIIRTYGDSTREYTSERAFREYTSERAFREYTSERAFSDPVNINE